MIICNIEKFGLGLMIFIAGLIFMTTGFKPLAVIYLFIGLLVMWTSWTKGDPNTPVRI